MKVAEYVASFLKQNGIKHLFGYQGGAVLKLVDCVVNEGIEYVQNYHEQASAFGADAYSRINNNLGAAISTSGPGATNLITGIANAYYDSIPTLFITGQDYTTNIHKAGNARQDGFQEVDIAAVVKPITKYAVTIMDYKDIRYELEKALYMAKEGRAGAVLVDIPIDVQFEDIDPETLKSFTPKPRALESNNVSAKDVLETLNMAKRPVILAGGGIRLAGALDDFKAFADRTGIPVVTTLNALDCYEKAFSFSGLYGNTHSNIIVNNADVLLVLGSRLGLRQVSKFRETYTDAKILQVDIDINEKNRSLNADVFIHQDLKTFMKELNDVAANTELTDRTSWYKKAEEWQDKYAKNSQVNTEGLDPVKILRKMFKMLDDDAIVTSDVGQNQMWIAQAFIPTASRRLLNSSGHGAMGFSLPAAIGARYAAPDKQVVAFMGDGGLNMNIQELLTVAHRNLDIKIVVLNNNTLGMMREVQARYFESRFLGSGEKDFVCPNLEKLAKAYELAYMKIDKEADLEELGRVLASDKPAIIDLRITQNSKAMNRYDEKQVIENEKIDDKLVF